MELSRRDLLRYGLGVGALIVTGGCGQSADQLAESRGRRPQPRRTTTTAGTTTSVGPPTLVNTTNGAQPTTTGGTTATDTCCSTPIGGRWSDAKTWASGAVPQSGQNVQVAGSVVLDVDADVNGMTITDGAALHFDPAQSRLLRSTANVVVLGRLSMRPNSATVSHTISFQGVQESRFVGGGMSVLDSDVGLWVTEMGVLDLAGAPKLAWSRTASSLAAGARTIDLIEIPAGWRVGDELAVTPTQRWAAVGGQQAEVVKITGISGRTVQLDRALSAAHPTVDAGPMGSLGAEILNLTRNVAIEGTPGSRAHVMIVHAMTAQSIAHTSLRYMAPQKGDDGVLGRYALHFHHCGDGSKGSLIEGVVVRDTGSHAFVPHVSNGTTFRNCIAHDVTDFAYWWDGGDESANTVFDGCVASNVGDNEANKYFSGGFLLGLGPASSNVVRNCVTAGSSKYGFVWYSNSEAVWDSSSCVAHNNGLSGIWVWQNNELNQVITDFVSYRNGEYGIDHGAYANAYRYQGGAMVENGEAAMRIHAVSVPNDSGQGQLTFDRMYLDAGGTDFAILAPDGSAVNPLRPTYFTNLTIRNAKKAGISWDGEGRNALALVKGCSFNGNELFLQKVGSGTRIEFPDSKFGSVVASTSGRGRSVPEWNAGIVSL